MIDLSRDYVESVLKPAFEKEIHEQTGKHFSYQNAAEVMDNMVKGTMSGIFGELKITTRNLQVICDKFNIPGYAEWKKTHDRRALILNHLVNNHWLSYRFTSKRGMHISSWLFEHAGDKLKLTKKTPNGFNFEGVFTLDKNFNLSGEIVNHTLTITYQTWFPVDGKVSANDKKQAEADALLLQSFNCIVLNGFVKHGDDVYATTEIMIRQEAAKPADHDHSLVTEKNNCRIFFKPQEDGMPGNDQYIAYNFLTRFSTKSRVKMVDREFNLRMQRYYRHKIRVGCPVRSIENETEFDRIAGAARAIRQTLIDAFKFAEKDIYFELPTYTSKSDIKEPNTYIIESNRTISFTHFMAIFPKMKQTSLGITSEIFYRIGKKLPVVIYHDGDDALPPLLLGLKNSGPVINTRFCNVPLEKIATDLVNDKEKLLCFQLP